MLREKMPFPPPCCLSVGAALFAVLLCSVGPARAYPTSAPQFGPSGLGLMPTTDTVNAKAIEVGLGYEDVDPDAGGSVRFFPTATVAYGFENGEVGAGYLRERVSFGGIDLDFDYFVAHGKYRIWEDKGGRGAIALGAHYLDFNDTPGNVLSLYATGSYVLWRAKDKRLSLRGHLGVLHQRIDGGPGFEENETRPMVGLELRCKENWTLAADYLPSSGVTVKQMSAVARYDGGRWGAQIGIGEFRGGDRKIFGSALYRFGGGKSEATSASASAPPPHHSSASSGQALTTSLPHYLTIPSGGRVYEAAPGLSAQEAAP